LTELDAGLTKAWRSPIVRGGLGQLCGVCVIHLGSTWTVRTLLALGYGSATKPGFEWGFEGRRWQALRRSLYL